MQTNHNRQAMMRERSPRSKNRERKVFFFFFLKRDSASRSEVQEQDAQAASVDFWTAKATQCSSSKYLRYGTGKSLCCCCCWELVVQDRRFMEHSTS